MEKQEGIVMNKRTLAAIVASLYALNFMWSMTDGTNIKTYHDATNQIAQYNHSSVINKVMNPGDYLAAFFKLSDLQSIENLYKPNKISMK